MSITYEIYLACLGCGVERVLERVSVESMEEAWGYARSYLKYANVSSEELYVRPATEQQRPIYEEDHVA